jgi:hypothetical protein
MTDVKRWSSGSLNHWKGTLYMHKIVNKCKTFQTGSCIVHKHQFTTWTCPQLYIFIPARYKTQNYDSWKLPIQCRDAKFLAGNMRGLDGCLGNISRISYDSRNVTISSFVPTSLFFFFFFCIFKCFYSEEITKFDSIWNMKFLTTRHPISAKSLGRYSSLAPWSFFLVLGKIFNIEVRN